jgi:uncharacterized protein (DUF302 family)
MENFPHSKYGYVKAVAVPFDEAVSRLEAGLKTEGFGVLATIDIQAKLKEKLGVDFGRYIILGACNPPIAHQALRQEINLGLLLPCNAVVYEQDGRTFAGAVDAKAMLSVVGNPEMDALAEQVNDQLRRAVDAVSA